MADDPLEDWELASIARYYSPAQIRVIAMYHMGFTQPELDTISEDRQNDADGFKREVLIRWRNKNNPNQRKVF